MPIANEDVPVTLAYSDNALTADTGDKEVENVTVEASPEEANDVKETFQATERSNQEETSTLYFLDSNYNNMQKTFIFVILAI